MFSNAARLIFQISVLHILGIKANVIIPENIKVTFLSSVSAKISWSIELTDIEKYDIMYKPTEASYRVVAVVAANSNSVTLNNLLPNTQYQMSVTAIKSGRKYRSRPIVFRTLESGAVVRDAITSNDNETVSGNIITLGTPDVVPGTANTISPNSVSPPQYGPSNMPQTYIQVRAVEVTIVVLVLMVWVGAIIMFFNRWGKIRMLIPYQPDYKETQLKVPGTGACSNSNTYQNQTGSTLCCSQRKAHQYFKHALNQNDQSNLENVSSKRARFHSVSCQHMKLAGQSNPVRKTKSADYILVNHNKIENYKIVKKIPTVSISIASDSDNGIEEDSS